MEPQISPESMINVNVWLNKEKKKKIAPLIFRVKFTELYYVYVCWFKEGIKLLSQAS